MTPEELSERLLEFAAHMGLLIDRLPDTRLGRHVAGQLVRCGTSGPPNYEEACAAESRADFVHKLKVVLKELRETRSWLRYIIKTHLLPAAEIARHLDESTQLCNIIGQSLVTAKGLNKKPEPPTQSERTDLRPPDRKPRPGN